MATVIQRNKLEAELKCKLDRRGRHLLWLPARSAEVQIRAKFNAQCINTTFRRRGIRRIRALPRKSDGQWYYTDRGELVFRRRPALSGGQFIYEQVLVPELSDAELWRLLDKL